MLYDEKMTLTRRSTERILTEEETSILTGIEEIKKQERSDEHLPAAAVVLSIIPLIIFGVAAYAVYSRNYILFGYIMGGIFSVAGIGISIPRPNTISIAFALAGIWCIVILCLRNMFPGTDTFILTLGLGEAALVGLSILTGIIIGRLTSKQTEAVCTGYARRAVTDHTGRDSYRILTAPIFMIDGKEYIPNDMRCCEDAGFDIGEKVPVRLERDGELIIHKGSSM